LKPLSWDEVEKNFIQEIQLGTNFDVSFVTVPIESIVHTLCVYPDIGGSLQKHFVVCLWQSNNLFLETYLQMN